MRSSILLAGLMCLAPLLPAADGPHFEGAVGALFAQKCQSCHGASMTLGKFDARSVPAMIKGGASGPALTPGVPEKSLLLERVISRTMPPGKEKLNETEIQLLRGWIAAGAPVSLASGATKLAAAVTEDEVLPIFQVRCVACHGKRKQEAGLDLRTVASRLKGGRSGPAVVPGKPEESLIIQRIQSGDMPPAKLQLEYAVRPPTAVEVEKLKAWIAGGLQGTEPRVVRVDPASDPMVKPADRNFWSFQPPRKAPVPARAGVKNPIDAFLLEKLESKSLQFAPRATRQQLLRRAYLDLTGMPPTPEEARAFLNDEQPDAWARLIDRLLSSPSYGERWGRYWLDLAGYSDSEGFGQDDGVRPFAWRYRDYVIRAFNADKPYSEFLTEQIAGDELADYKKEKQITQATVDRLAATGFLRTTPDPTNAPERGFIAERMNIIADEVEVLSSSVIGLTIGCARCHNHKYDPIPQRDYYRLSAILQSSYDPYDWLSPNKRELDVALDEERKEAARHNEPLQAEIKKLEAAIDAKAKPYREKLLVERLEALPAGVREDLRALSGVAEEKRSDLQRYLAIKFASALTVENDALARKYPEFKSEYEPLRRQMDQTRGKLKPKPHVRVLMDTGGTPSASYLLRRGDPITPIEAVEPGVPSVVAAGLKPYRPETPFEGSTSSGRRLALARWLTQPGHPLTSRVLVNHVWLRHFGRGIVASPSNFGRSGLAPSNQKLLDWLAVEFEQKGWSIKSLHRLIMTSEAYQQSSRVSDAVIAADPENAFVSRMPMRRLDAEALYDSVLRATGRLDPSPFGPAEPLDIKPDKEVIPKGSANGFRRGIYVLQRRQTPVTLFEAFDQPPMTPNCVERRQSTVATQALQMFNGTAVWEHARFMAGRIIDEAGEDRARQIQLVYWRALSRAASETEVAEGLGALSDFTKHWMGRLESDRSEAPKEWTARWRALSSFCHTILNSAEFSYVD